MHNTVYQNAELFMYETALQAENYPNKEYFKTVLYVPHNVRSTIIDIETIKQMLMGSWSMFYLTMYNGMVSSYRQILYKKGGQVSTGCCPALVHTTNYMYNLKKGNQQL